MIPHQRYMRATDIGSVGGYFRPPLIDVLENIGIDKNDGNNIDNSEIKNSNNNYNTDNDIIRLGGAAIALGKGRDNHMDWMWMDGTEVRFTTLPWIERQLVREWRTYEWSRCNGDIDDFDDDDDCDLNVVNEDFNDDNGNYSLSNEGNAISNENTKHHNHDDETLDAKNNNKQINNKELVSLSEDDDDEEERLMDQLDTGEYERARTLAPRPLPRPEWEHATSCYMCQRSFGPTLHRHHCRR